MKFGHAATSNPVFGTVENILPPLLVGRGLHLSRRTSSFRLGDADRWFISGKDMLCAECFLLRSAITHHSADATHISFDDYTCRQRTHLSDLLDHHGDIEITGALTSIFPRDGHAHNTSVHELTDIFPTIAARPVPLRRTFLKIRRQFFCNVNKPMYHGDNPSSP